MLIAKRNPMMKQALAAERGVTGTYAVAVLAIVGSVLSAGLMMGSAQDARQPEAASVSEPGIPVWVDVAAPMISYEPAVELPAPVAPKTSVVAHGADVDQDQPFYDEAAAVSIYTR